MNVGRYLRGEDRHVGTARTTQPQPPHRTEKKMVMWPCLIDSADFSENTITLVMQCEDYKVTAGPHYLTTTSPQRTWVGLTDEEIDYFIVHRLTIATKNNLVALIRICEAKLKEKNQ